ncbi:MAG: FAD-dependent oxidoreductase [Gammaproteobacteria bacterium]
MSASDFDLVVVGAGGAGLCAAVTAAELGCSVLVVESEQKVGGSTGHSDGVFNAADTSVQRAIGLEDSIDEYIDYYMTLNAWRQPASMVRTFCENATPTLEWLISLGVEIPKRIVKKPEGAVYPTAVDAPGLYAAGVEYPPRGHCPVGGGQSYIDVLENRRGVLGVELVMNTRVRKLLVDAGRVTGIEADGQRIRARAVALTCGGFGQDLELVREYFPDAYKSVRPGDHPTTITAPGSRGDSIRMGLQAGAHITGVNCGLLGSTAYVRRKALNGHPGFQPTSLIYVNRDGLRFTDETAPYAVMPGLIKAEGYVVWGIFDEAARLRSDPTKTGYSRGWDPAFVLDCVQSGDFHAAPTLDELARKCGIGAAALATQVHCYNEDLAHGTDRMFLRDLKGLHPIATPPFYAFEYRTSDVQLTGAGVRIDTGCHALDRAGRIIPGLFAAGESGAGVLGERYVGGGNSVGNALTMGRVAGRTIARELKD